MISGMEQEVSALISTGYNRSPENLVVVLRRSQQTSGMILRMFYTWAQSYCCYTLLSNINLENDT